MADIKSCPPLTRQSVQAAHKRIKQYVHRTPVITCKTINEVACTPQSERSTEFQYAGQDNERSNDARPNVRLFFKCENEQKIGAFKARGAFHSLSRLIDQKGLENVRKTGVCTHSSGMSSDDQCSCVADS